MIHEKPHLLWSKQAYSYLPSKPMKLLQCLLTDPSPSPSSVPILAHRYCTDLTFPSAIAGVDSKLKRALCWNPTDHCQSWNLHAYGWLRERSYSCICWLHIDLSPQPSIWIKNQEKTLLANELKRIMKGTDGGPKLGRIGHRNLRNSSQELGPVLWKAIAHSRSKYCSPLQHIYEARDAGIENSGTYTSMCSPLST